MGRAIQSLPYSGFLITLLKTLLLISWPWVLFPLPGSFSSLSPIPMLLLFILPCKLNPSVPWKGDQHFFSWFLSGESHNQLRFCPSTLTLSSFLFVFKLFKFYTYSHECLYIWWRIRWNMSLLADSNSAVRDMYNTITVFGQGQTLFQSLMLASS